MAASHLSVDVPVVLLHDGAGVGGVVPGPGAHLHQDNVTLYILHYLGLQLSI